MEKRKWSFKHEVGRKIIHLMMLLVLIAYFFINIFYGRQSAMLFLAALLMAFLILEYLRLELNWNVPFFSKFIRPKEQNRVYGVIFFISATIISLAAFDFKIAIAALLMTTFGDMAAAIIGKRYGRTSIFRSKTFAGSMAELIVNLMVGFLVLFRTNILVIIAMAVTATAAEILTDELDDNLVVPVFSGFVGQILLIVI